MAQAAQMNVIEINSPVRVEHDKKRRQFTIRLNGSYDRAVLLYEYVGKKTVDLQHTEVPDAFRGRGIAKHLAKSNVQDFRFSKKECDHTYKCIFKFHLSLESQWFSSCTRQFLGSPLCISKWQRWILWSRKTSGLT
ncbi:hypothetical protein Q7C36_017546 [Tachysurus vachellii]|uniref:Protein NATD1 n=1 Tax=Tachysurus vachellii TaxID=175792 RepID=A0AA88SF03_TACVA|nr:hypothetical protein Q7C36_017546 [Tachysurus vachellii]